MASVCTINRLDGRPHFILRAVLLTLFMPFWFAWQGVQKLRGKSAARFPFRQVR